MTAARRNVTETTSETAEHSHVRMHFLQEHFLCYIAEERMKDRKKAWEKPPRKPFWSEWPCLKWRLAQLFQSSSVANLSAVSHCFNLGGEIPKGWTFLLGFTLPMLSLPKDLKCIHVHWEFLQGCLGKATATVPGDQERLHRQKGKSRRGEHFEAQFSTFAIPA